MVTNTYDPTPLHEAWQAVVQQQEPPRLTIDNFLDDWRRFGESQVRQNLVRAPIPDSGVPEIHRWSVFVAALVEYLTVRDNLPTPGWVYDPKWVLDEPWFLNPYWKLRGWLLVATPPPWKRRRIFGGDETMMIGRV